MATSTQLVNQIVSSTGQIATDMVPFLYLFLGVVFALFALGFIFRVFKYSFKRF